MFKTAMILAAGKGERLKPLTEKIPKALALVHQKPVIEYHILNLVKNGFQRVVINHAHLGYKLRHYLGDGERFGIEICYSPEPPGGLETGGGIVHALPLLGQDPFVVINSDIFCNFNVKSLQLNPQDLANLVLIPATSSQNADFGLTKENKLTIDHKKYIFTGIAAYHPLGFKNYKTGRYSVTLVIADLIKIGKISAQVFKGLWIDIGNPHNLEMAQNL